MIAAAALQHVRVTVTQPIDWSAYLAILVPALVALMGAMALWLRAQANKISANSRRLRTLEQTQANHVGQLDVMASTIHAIQGAPPGGPS